MCAWFCCLPGRLEDDTGAFNRKYEHLLDKELEEWVEQLRQHPEVQDLTLPDVSDPEDKEFKVMFLHVMCI